VKAFHEQGLSACAGVAIVGTHYPFARAYGLAAELCQTAKLSGRGPRARQPEKESWLDFHIVRDGGSGSVQAVRDRNFSGPLRLWRPWRVAPVVGDESELMMLQTVVGAFTDQEVEGNWTRNRARRLRSELEQRQRPGALVLWCVAFERFSPRKLTVGLPGSSGGGLLGGPSLGRKLLRLAAAFDQCAVHSAA
jgi:hypothetical protein